MGRTGDFEFKLSDVKREGVTEGVSILIRGFSKAGFSGKLISIVVLNVSLNLIEEALLVWRICAG